MQALDRSDSRSALDALRTLRAGLRDNDVSAVSDAFYRGPRPAGEADLLATLSASEGLPSAIERLRPFWRRAQTRIDQVRPVNDAEVEVYERLALADEEIPIVSLLRQDRDAHWRVVCTRESRDERFRIWLLTNSDLGSEVPSVIRHANGPWSASVRGFIPERWPDNLPTHGTVVELTMALPPRPDDRHPQLRWMLGEAHSLLRRLGGVAAYLPAHRRLMHARPMEAAGQGSLHGDQAFRFWARLDRIDGFLVTRGLSMLGLPELEVRLHEVGPRRAARLISWLGARLLDGKRHLPGAEIVLDQETYAIVPGRRGPRAGESYGRWGSLGASASRQARVTKSYLRLEVGKDERG